MAPARLGGRARLAVTGLLLCLGCPRQRPPCSADLPSLIELRGGNGGLELALRAPPTAREDGSLDLCDAGGARVGRLSEGRTPRTVRLDNAAGDPMVRLSAAPGEDPSFIRGGERPGRLHDEANLLRLLDPDGVPVGQVGVQGDRLVAFNGAGLPLATAETVEHRQVVRRPDGSVRYYAIGLATPRAAALLALDRLPLAERLAVARFIDGGPPPSSSR